MLTLSVLGLGASTGCSGSGDGACGTGEVDCDGVCIAEVEPRLEAIHSRVFTLSCAASACHDDSRPPEGLDLSSPESARASLVGVSSVQVDGRPLVDPGNSDGSYLVDKLLGENLGPASATGTPSKPMPLGGSALCDPKVDAVREWIDLGAP